MSTSGLVVSTAPTCGSAPESTLTTPAGMSVWLAISSPSASVTSGVSGAALRITVQPGGQRGRQLGQRQLVRIVVGDDGRDDAGGFLLHPAVMLHAAALDVAEVLGHRIGLQQFRVVAHDLDGLVVLRAGEQRRRWHRPRRWSADAISSRCSTRAACSCSRQWMRNSTLVDQSVVSKALTGRGDRRLGVRHGCVGGVSEHLAGGGVEAGERPAAAALDELAVDEHPAIGTRPVAHRVVQRWCRGIPSGPPRRERVDIAITSILIFGESYIRQTRTLATNQYRDPAVNTDQIRNDGKSAHFKTVSALTLRDPRCESTVLIFGRRDS